MGVSRNWENLPPNQRSRPVQYSELIEEMSRKGRQRVESWCISSNPSANPRSLSVIRSVDIKDGGAGMGELT